METPVHAHPSAAVAQVPLPSDGRQPTASILQLSGMATEKVTSPVIWICAVAAAPSVYTREPVAAEDVSAAVTGAPVQVPRPEPTSSMRAAGKLWPSSHTASSDACAGGGPSQASAARNDDGQLTWPGGASDSTHTSSTHTKPSMQGQGRPVRSTARHDDAQASAREKSAERCMVLSRPVFAPAPISPARARAPARARTSRGATAKQYKRRARRFDRWDTVEKNASMAWLLSLVLAASLANDARFLDGTTRFKDLDYEGALAAFDALLAEPRQDDERAVLLLYSGAARVLLGDETGARLAFEAALRADPGAEPGFRTSPKVLALFHDVKEAFAAAAPASASPGAAGGPPASTTSRQEPGPGVVPGIVPGGSAALEPAPAAMAPTTTTPSTSPPPTGPAAPLSAPPPSAAGPAAATWIGVGAAAATVGALATGAVFGYDVVDKMGVAGNKATPQRDAQALVDAANGSLVWAAALGGAGVVAAGIAVTAFVWP